MTDTNTEDAAPPTVPSTPVADALHKEAERIEHGKSHVIHAVEHIVDKVHDTLGNKGGRK